jgi:aspartokinase-like uncharacterized kinase
MMDHSPSAAAPSVGVVYKLGGSLLEWAGLADALDRVLEHEIPGRSVALVGGGGTSADAVLRWDEAHELGAACAHQLAIAAMDFNARMIRELLQKRGRAFVTQAEDLRPGAILIPDMEDELRLAGNEVPGPSWEVTSDSLAAWLARRLGATRIVLLKSTDPPEDRRLATATARQLVDSRFAESVRGLEVEWINLRGSTILPVIKLVP